MQDKQVKDVIEYLGNIGFTARAIPTGRKRSADIKIENDERGYLIEVKSRYDSEEWEKTLKKDGVALQSTKIGFSRWAVDVANYSLKQFLSIDPNHKMWWILWLEVERRDGPETAYEQILNTLFGAKQVIDIWSDSDPKPMWNCLNIMPGVFERNPDIVAAIVSNQNSISICGNEFSPDYKSFKKSKLAQSLLPINTVSELRKMPDFIIVDDLTIDRKNEKEIEKYLKQNFGIGKPIIVNMEYRSATAFIPKK